ncbi:glucose 1-dehydrogenase [Acinetobacter nectaris]|uniref:glucose 1-dehydrogenase n=1 Tax=Acinetobacter nectaris TaxID=1219382 RepID=UPI001F00858B|nr:glucose 1-dehydrogenase [Acinetobacter nectaris]MCF9000150.1 glucose 1-dehydrogenase [Acinetobacter nectaris]MCF9028521.1 glucose 1-dehydrogenase [Acinetobacter nectaris]
MFDLSNKLALVTGSSRGLGNTLASALASAGARVILHGRNSKSLDSAAIEWEKSHGIRPDTVLFDVQDAAGVEAAVNDLIEKFGTPDILVNNAGIQRRAPFSEFSISDWDDIIATNLSSVFYVSRFIVPHMMHRGSGKIINIASVQSELGRQTIAPYAASKGGVALLTRGMTADLARHNIQVNTLSPGYFATDMNSALVADKNFTTWLEQRTPAGRWGRPEELAGALVFLASSASDFITGQNLFVDGGMTAVV